jgi:excisionase family DNA binding protein
MLKVDDVCARLYVSRDTVYRMIRIGALPARRQAGHKGWCISPEDLDAFVASGLEAHRNSAVLSVADVCRRLNCSPETVRRLVNAGDLPAYKLGGKNSHLRIPEAALADYLDRHTVAAAAHA